MSTWEIIARGKVQGVGFRWFVQKSASVHGVCGYVRNLSDGTVYILAQAEEHVLDSFQLSLQQGSRFASVAGLEVSKIDSAKEYNEFEIK
ncbi:MAG: acylphosphatase [Candidatus Cloacimonetes bacterium]|nr:acylphosphatase [Candidatus Cloacimonadota bacterium]